MEDTGGDRDSESRVKTRQTRVPLQRHKGCVGFQTPGKLQLDTPLYRTGTACPVYSGIHQGHVHSCTLLSPTQTVRSTTETCLGLGSSFCISFIIILFNISRFIQSIYKENS